MISYAQNEAAARAAPTPHPTKQCGHAGGTAQRWCIEHNTSAHKSQFCIKYCESHDNKAYLTHKYVRIQYSYMCVDIILYICFLIEYVHI